MQKTQLRNELNKRVKNFIQDNYIWEQFVQKTFDFQTGVGRSEVQIKWEAMLDKYCVPNKMGRDGASVTDRIHHLPEEEHIVDYKIDCTSAIVFTQVRWIDGYRKGEIEPYEFEFKLENDVWVLNQIYLMAPRARFECI